MRKDRRMSTWVVFVTVAVTLLASSFGSMTTASTDPSTLTWSKTVAAEANIWKDIAFGNGVYVAVSSNGTNRVMRTTDPTCTPVGPATSCWTGVNVGAEVEWQSVTFGEGLFVAVGAGNNDSLAMTSPDGITWTRHVTNPAHQRTWNSVEYANGNFVAVAFRISERANIDVMTSPDGVTWTLRTTPEFSGCTTSNGGSCNQFTGLAYGNGAWVAVSTDDQNGPSFNVMRSTNDGVTWTYVTVPSAQKWRDVTFSGSEFIAVSRNTTGPKMMTSADGITWTERNAPAADGVEAVGSTVVIVNGNSTGITYSYTANLSCTPAPPATHCFTAPPSGSSDAHFWQSIKYLNQRFFLVGMGGTERVAYTSVFTAPAPHTVTFDLNDGTGASVTQAAVPSSNLQSNTFTRTGFTFAGWNTAADGTGTSYADGASFPFATNTTLYAQWTPVPSGGGTTGSPPPVVTTPPSTTVPSTTAPPVPVPGPAGSLPVLSSGEALVTENNVSVPVQLLVENDEALVLRSPNFELRLQGACTDGCTIVEDAIGRETIHLDRSGGARVSGFGFLPGSLVHVWIFSEPRYLGALLVQPDGTYEGSFPLTDIEAGGHTLQANGFSSDNVPRSVNLGVVVVDSTTPNATTLPTTGAEMATGAGKVTVVMATLLVLLGIAARTTSRRRIIAR